MEGSLPRWISCLPGKAMVERREQARRKVRRGCIVRQGVATCVTVPHGRRREAVRPRSAPSFVAVFVDTPSNLCLMRRAARGRRPSASKRFKAAYRRLLEVVRFSRRLSYQPSLSPEVTIRGHEQPPGEAAQTVFRYLVKRGFVTSDNAQGCSSGEPANGELQTVS
jgi:adenylylsulfate kinase-like enzyme